MRSLRTVRTLRKTRRWRPSAVAHRARALWLAEGLARRARCVSLWVSFGYAMSSAMSDFARTPSPLTCCSCTAVNFLVGDNLELLTPVAGVPSKRQGNGLRRLRLHTRVRPAIAFRAACHQFLTMLPDSLGRRREDCDLLLEVSMASRFSMRRCLGEILGLS